MAHRLISYNPGKAWFILLHSMVKKNIMLSGTLGTGSYHLKAARKGEIRFWALRGRDMANISHRELLFKNWVYILLSVKNRIINVRNSLMDCSNDEATVIMVRPPLNDQLYQPGVKLPTQEPLHIQIIILIILFSSRITCLCRIYSFPDLNYFFALSLNLLRFFFPCYPPCP